MKERQLELKDIVGYLPYGLEWSLQEMKTFTMSGITSETLYTKEGPVLNWKKHKYLPQALFPILYDISCLTEEIEVNGERFVPIVDLLKIHQKEWYDYHINSKYSEIEYQHSPNVIKASFTFMASLSVIVLPKELHSEPYWVIQKLYSWHIDINGLIPAGLAIDKKTLK